MQWRYSLLGKFALWAFVLALLASLCSIGVYSLTHSVWLAIASTAIAMLLLTTWSARMLFSTTQRTLQTLIGGIQGLRDGDYTIGISKTTRDELGDVVQAFNELTATLRDEHQTIYQRELLLDTVIQATPVALILTNAKDAVLYGNLAARQLLTRGKKFEGLKFASVMETAPAPLREAVESENDVLITLEMDGEPEVFHLSKRQFWLNTQEHHLILLKQMTREVNAQEVATWKKVMRVVAHEINNSLAPISSLAHSGLALLHLEDGKQLTRVLETIQERAHHLQSFVEGYARFTRLPKPTLAPVAWSAFFDGLRRTVPFTLDSELPALPGCFDAAQITQTMINLIKNALEAGSPPEQVRVAVSAGEQDVRIEVRDRGSGMSHAALQSALLPFYSTKSTGTGLGLALCREIIEAHAGRISVANRKEGGVVVSLWLPAAIH